jgi:predicted nucleic acid-binding protein
VKVVFDSSVWIEELRRGALTPLLPRLRGTHRLWMDALVAAELRAGCRSRVERRVVESLLVPFERAGRVCAPSGASLSDAGRALSKLRERGVALSNGAGALIDASIATDASRLGALLVSANVRDFAKLQSVMKVRFETFADFSARVVG